MKLAKGYLATHITTTTYWYWVNDKGYWFNTLKPIEYAATNWLRDVHAIRLFKELDHETMSNI